MTAPTLRPYQQQGVADIRAAYASGHRRALYVLPTGGGKTLTFSYITHHAAAKRQRVWILAHRVELLDQISRTLGEFGTRHGFIAAGYPAHKDALVQVAGVFTVARRLPGERVAFHNRVAAPDLIICDEAHHATNATTWGRILSAFPRARVLGVTATPCRLDGTGLGECFDAMVLGPSVAELTAQGALVPLKAYAPASIATEGLHTRAGEFIASELAVRADNATVTGDAVAHYRRLADGKAAVAFCVSVEHARHVAESFTAAGIPAQSVDGTMDRTVRRAVIEAFVKGQIRVLTSCDLVSEGFDVPRVEVGISLRPTQSTGLWLQQCLDDGTEILTPDGWCTRGEVGVGDIVAAYDTATGAVEWKMVTEKIERPLAPDEQMYGIASPHLDIRVTGGHDMVVRSNSRTTREWRKERAEQMARRKGLMAIPVAGVMAGGDVRLSDDEIRLIGWYLTDGTINHKTGGLSVSQSAGKAAHCEEIRRVFRACGIKFGETRVRRTGEYAKYDDLIQFRASRGLPRGTDKHLRGWGHLAPWMHKEIAAEMWLLSPRQVGVLLDAMNLGDGANANRSITWTRHTMSITCGDNRVMANRMQALLVTKGFRCNVSRYTPKDGRSTWYTLHVRERTTATIAGTNIAGRPYARSRFAQVESVAGEIVWCVTNDLGTLITRRNGKVAVVGNCGRIMRPSPGKSHAILLDHAGNIARHGLPEDERDWSLDGLAPKARAANEVADVAMRVCGSCYAAVRGRPVACPECGVAFPVQARTVDVADGELAEVTRETRRPLTPERRATLREQGQATEYEALVALGMKRGMKNPSGWAKHVMEARAAKAAREGKLTQGVA